MIETGRLRAMLVASVLAATPVAAQTSPANPFGLSQAPRTEDARPHRHHGWRMERFANRMRWRGERMERHGRWLARQGRPFRGRAWARRGARYEHRGLRAEAREFRLHHRGERWRGEHARRDGRGYGERRREHGRFRTSDDSNRVGGWRGRAQVPRHGENRSESDGTL